MSSVEDADARVIAESFKHEGPTSVKCTTSLSLAGTAFQLPDFSTDTDLAIGNLPQLGAAASTESSATRSRLQHLAARDTDLVVVTSPLHREAKPSNPTLNKAEGTYTAQYLRPRLPSAMSSADDSEDDIPYPDPFESASHPAAGSEEPEEDFESLRDRAVSQMPYITAILHLVAQSPEQYGLLPLSPQQGPTGVGVRGVGVRGVGVTGCSAEARRGELALEFVAAVMLLAARTSESQLPNGTHSAAAGLSSNPSPEHDRVASAAAGLAQSSFERDRAPIPSRSPAAAASAPRARPRASRTAVFLSSPPQAIWASPCRDLQDNEQVPPRSTTPDRLPIPLPTQPSSPLPHTPSAVDSTGSRTSIASRAPDVKSLRGIARGAVYGDTSIRSVLDFILAGPSSNGDHSYSDGGHDGGVCVQAEVRWACLTRALLQSHPPLTSAELRDAITAATAILAVPNPGWWPIPLPSGAVLRAAWGVGSQLCRVQGMKWSRTVEGDAELGLADAELGPADGITISGCMLLITAVHGSIGGPGAATMTPLPALVRAATVVWWRIAQSVVDDPACQRLAIWRGRIPLCAVIGWLMRLVSTSEQVGGGYRWLQVVSHRLRLLEGTLRERREMGAVGRQQQRHFEADTERIGWRVVQRIVADHRPGASSSLVHALMQREWRSELSSGPSPVPPAAAHPYPSPGTALTPRLGEAKLTAVSNQQSPHGAAHLVDIYGGSDPVSPRHVASLYTLGSPHRRPARHHLVHPETALSPRSQRQPAGVQAGLWEELCAAAQAWSTWLQWFTTACSEAESEQLVGRQAAEDAVCKAFDALISQTVSLI